MLSIIVAVDENNAIGKNNSLLWHISEDLKYFKSVTTGHPVIMGRKTFESIGRALPNRTNIIITRNSVFKAEGCIIANSLEEAINYAKQISDEYFVIGGGTIYKEAMEKAGTIYLTEVHHKYEADTFFPAIDKKKWKEIERTDFVRGKDFPFAFSFVKLVKTVN